MRKRDERYERWRRSRVDLALIVIPLHDLGDCVHSYFDISGAMKSFLDGCLCPLLFVAMVILLWVVMVVGCQANPVPEKRLNPFMTEDDAVGIMRAWSWDPNGRPRVILQFEGASYYVGVGYVNSSPDFVWLGRGPSLKDALRNAVESGYVHDRAKAAEFLRRK